MWGEGGRGANEDSRALGLGTRGAEAPVIKVERATGEAGPGAGGDQGPRGVEFVASTHSRLEVQGCWRCESGIQDGGLTGGGSLGAIDAEGALVRRVPFFCRIWT